MRPLMIFIKFELLLYVVAADGRGRARADSGILFYSLCCSRGRTRTGTRARVQRHFILLSLGFIDVWRTQSRNHSFIDYCSSNHAIVKSVGGCVVFAYTYWYVINVSKCRLYHFISETKYLLYRAMRSTI